jgi:uncharacterized protein (TIGR03492 family)
MSIQESRSRRKILFISNGHGEDAIACKIIRRLAAKTVGADLDVHAWPMVGEGAAYRELGIQATGARNTLPSCGFATLSLKWMLEDLRHGWISTHLKQIRSARRLRDLRFKLIVAVGDIVPIGAAVLAGAPFFFVGCAKSSYYTSPGSYTGLEKFLLRKYCLTAFPRDALTAEELSRARVPNAYAGNPMMDDLEGTDAGFELSPETRVVGLLPGSRTDAVQNALHLLEAAAKVDAEKLPFPVAFLFAVPDAFDPAGISRGVRESPAVSEWKIEAFCESPSDGVTMRFAHPRGFPAWLVKNRFADVLRRSTLVVGVAGTANEQAVGLGKPLITFPTRGPMGPCYVSMKMQFFGESALQVSPEPQAVAEAVVALLLDKERCARMGRVGMERMGVAGASDAIARNIVDYF